MSIVEEIAAAREAGTPMRPTGSLSRGDWGGPDVVACTPLSTLGLDRIVEHNPGDFTAILEAGVPVAVAQAAFAAHGQWLALDPPEGGTIGGLFATADSGPSRQRYGGGRDLIIGATVALSDGPVAASGGRVIKNVAGYDLGKLFTGSRGTLGVLTSVAVRLHPLPARTATVVARTDDPATLGAAAVALAGQPIEALCLDAYWRGDHGGLLIRFGGRAATEQAERVAASISTMDASVVTDDEEPWQRQRAGQRSATGVVLKVSTKLTDLPAVIDAARTAGAGLVSRAGLGLHWLTLDATQVPAVRAKLAPRPVIALDGASSVDDPAPVADPALRALTERVKARFDPAGLFRPGAFGGI
jgi:glycolate oxidase FAD binding subunit